MKKKQPPSPLRIRAMRSSAFGMYPQAVIAHLQPWSLVEWRGEFNMPAHMIASLKNWIGEVPAKQTATLNVTYKPKIMPVTGIVTRQTRFSTNDPKNAEVEVSVRLMCCDLCTLVIASPKGVAISCHLRLLRRRLLAMTTKRSQ